MPLVHVALDSMAERHPDNKEEGDEMKENWTTDQTTKSNFAEFLEIVQTAIHATDCTRSCFVAFPHQTLGDEADLRGVVVARTAGVGKINIDEFGFDTVAA